MEQTKVEVYDKETARKMHFLLKGYLVWCNEMLDYNYDPPRFVNAKGIYEVEGDVTKIKRNEEPSLEGLLRYLELLSK